MTTLKERRERGDLIPIYKSINNQEDTDKKNLIRKRKREARYLRRHKMKFQKGINPNYTIKYSFPREVLIHALTEER